MSIIWNGVSSDTIGVIVEKIPNRYIPTRRFSPQQIAGKNGNFLMVDKSFPNVEQEYEVYLSAESQGLPSVARACAEWLMGPTGYCRLTDSYDTTVYREAFLMGGFDLENILNKFGRCTITFSCKPQKYLLAGDTPIEIPAGSTTTYTGSSVQFDGITGASITSLSATIEPIQDLHGYDHPWPAGGGKNKFYYSTNFNSTGSYGLVYKYDKDTETFSITGTNTKTSAYIALFLKASDGTATPSMTVGQTCYVYHNLPTGTYMNLTYLDGNGVTKAFSIIGGGAGTGDYVQRSFIVPNDYASFSQLQIGIYGSATQINKTDIHIALGTDSAFTEWTPYSNICPISGLTGLSVYRTGKNLLDPAYRENIYSNVRYYMASENGLVLPPGDYVFSISEAPASLTVKNKATNENIKVTYSQKNTSFTLAEQTEISINAYYSTIPSAGLASVNCQLEPGSTATAYEPYNGNTYAVEWTTEAGTVYGGTLDVVTGVLTVDRASVDLTTGMAGGTAGSGYVFYKLLENAKTVPNSQIAPVISEAYVPIRYNAISSNVNRISIRDNGVIYVNTGGSDVQPIGKAVYELATPITYQLTPQEIEALVGTNNVWSSSGDVSVTVMTPLGGIVTNPTPFEARPLLEVSGVGEITINGKSIQILESVSDFQIDCEAMEAEDNSKIYCMDFPELSGGENEIVGFGSITALTVTPRWWTL